MPSHEQWGRDKGIWLGSARGAINHRTEIPRRRGLGQPVGPKCGLTKKMTIVWRLMKSCGNSGDGDINRARRNRTRTDLPRRGATPCNWASAVSTLVHGATK